MQRIYTDERFPGIEVWNDGSTKFNIRRNGRMISAFESRESGRKTVSEAFAARRAVDFYNRNARRSPAAELEEALHQITDYQDDSDIFNAPVSAGQQGEEIDRMLAREQEEKNPELKRRLRANILRLMRREESVAEGVVGHLLDS